MERTIPVVIVTPEPVEETPEPTVAATPVSTVAATPETEPDQERSIPVVFLTPEAEPAETPAATETPASGERTIPVVFWEPEADSGSQEAVEIIIADYDFQPALIEVPAGTTITWVNEDDVMHSVLERNRVFQTTVMSPGESASVTLDEPGRYIYDSDLYPNMEGVIVVVAAD